MAELTRFERWFPWRICIEDWSISIYKQIILADGMKIKTLQEWFTLTCHTCHKFTMGCGEKKCSFCGICPSCNKELEKMYKEELHT